MYRILALVAALIVVVVAAVALVTGAFGSATPGQDGVPATTAAYSYETGPDNQYHGYPELDTAEYGTDIPRCASDDWNADHVARCYTERVTDGAVLIIDASDTVIATLK